jgi:para-aminobenzoate synthetase
VQFHPESIATEHGQQLLQNFAMLTNEHLRNNPPRRRSTERKHLLRRPEQYNIVPAADAATAVAPARGTIRGKALRVKFRRLPMKLDAEQVFMSLFAHSKPAFWLDSAQVRNFSRFSYMGDARGPHAQFVTYNVNTGTVTVNQGGQRTTCQETIFSWLDRMLRERHVQAEGLPFDFNCGYVGYLGYELKAECGGSAAHASPTADAAMIFADRLIAFDHEQDMVYLVCVDDEDNDARADQWIAETAKKLGNLPRTPALYRNPDPEPVRLALRHSTAKYLKLIAACKEQIKLGESYEVCLTNMFTSRVEIDPLTTYRTLRSRNPTPYATYLAFPDVAVLSASPERFLTVDPYGVVDSKPIKGTRRRGSTPEEDEQLYQDLRSSEKDRSENLMIVDLVRNDLGAVCNFGSVHVSNMFTVETFATVHQLVSSIRGRLRRGISAVQAVQAAFPAGSMTGAPKKRTMEIIDRLEAGPRGVYSGAIGFFGLNGSTDLSVVIRTIVATNDSVTVGVGGAIIDLSDPNEEIEEVLLKSRASIHALAQSSLDAEPAMDAAPASVAASR